MNRSLPWWWSSYVLILNKTTKRLQRRILKIFGASILKNSWIWAKTQIETWISEYQRRKWSIAFDCISDRSDDKTIGRMFFASQFFKFINFWPTDTTNYTTTTQYNRNVTKFATQPYNNKLQCNKCCTYIKLFKPYERTVQPQRTYLNRFSVLVSVTFELTRNFLVKKTMLRNFPRAKVQVSKI